MAEEVNAQVVDGVTINNAKTVGEFGAQMSNMLLANMTAAQGRANDAANAHQQAMNQLLVEGQSQRAGHDVAESAATTPLAGVTDVLVSALAQILTKNAQSTPPETGKVG